MKLLKKTVITNARHKNASMTTIEYFSAEESEAVKTTECVGCGEEASNIDEGFLTGRICRKCFRKVKKEKQ